MNLLSNEELIKSRVTEGPLWPASPVTDGHVALNTARPAVHITPDRSIKRRTAEWSGASADVIHFTRREKVNLQFHAPVHLLIGYVDGLRRDSEMKIFDSHRTASAATANKLTFVPAGHEYRESHDPHVAGEIALFYLDADSIGADPMTDHAAAPLLPKMHFTDPVLWETVSKLSAVIEYFDDDDRPYLAALGAVLVHELRRLHRAARVVDAPARGGLAAWQRRVATEYIEANLADDIPLASLAELVRLSPHHFCRAFKQSLGRPPGQYHGHRRIERAKALLCSTTQSVTEIGLSLGYSETSSFTAAFHRSTGTTPTGYRRSLS